MSGDYSRFGFVPSQDYNAVLLQQGRPLTDADWNSQAAAINRRIQAGTQDISAPVVVAATTPDAFEITIGGPGGLLIGRGRMYVDGLLAENHGAGAPVWDTELAELYGKDPVAYNQQPYLPQPAPLATAGQSVIYLDVWQREVTYIEDPALVEKAIGVDTTTRLQTVWQVKAFSLGNSPTIDCSTPISAWTALTKPSGGRLTTDVDRFATTDPCLIPPVGGYTRLENQLYRVEIHTPGPLGTATFKWSRDNGSVATRVTQFINSATESVLVVESVGKDDVLRFSDGDWIEITDDWLELSGRPGELRRIKTGGGVDDARRMITLDSPPLTAGLFPTGNPDPGRHTRIRRWDQTSATGEIRVPASTASQILLENGVLVSFDMDTAGGDFRVGDYWVFAARTTDASIEILTNAPPRNIHHHYVKLAVFTPPTTIEDCRPKQEDCCCSISVHPGENIQTAINSLPPQGGCVCLKAGIHPISTAITISHSNVKLVGECAGTIVRISGPVVAAQDGIALMIGTADPNGIEGVAVSTIVFERQRTAATWFPIPIVWVGGGARRTAIEDCGFKDAIAYMSFGIMALSCEGLRVARCTFGTVMAGIWTLGPNNRELIVEDSIFNFGLDTQGKQSGSFGIVVTNHVGPCHIVRNRLYEVACGIVVDDNNADAYGAPASLAIGTMVAQNLVSCVPPSADMITQKVPAFGFYGIDVAADFSVVTQNTVRMLGRPGIARTGIRVTGTDLKVIDNEIGTRVNVPIVMSIGIQIGYAVAAANLKANQLASVLTTGVKVSGNSVHGLPFAIFAAVASNILIESNVIDVTGGIANSTDSVGIALAAVQGGKVNGNTIGKGATAIGSVNGTMNQITLNNMSNGGFGVILVLEAAPMVSGNRINNMAGWGVFCLGMSGCCDVVGNRVAFCGSGTDICGAIGAYYVYGELNVKLNEVKDTGLAADGSKSAVAAYGIWGVLIREAAIEGNLVTYSDPVARPVNGEDRALLMGGYIDYRHMWTPTFGTTIGYPIQILGNKFVGPGRSALVELTQAVLGTDVFSRFERVLFSNNYCMHQSPSLPVPPSKLPSAATVVLVGRGATVMGNQIKAQTPNFASVNFNGMPGPFIGNITNITNSTTGGVLNHTPFPAPQNGFNQIM
jgi:hypothetical protein